MIRNLEKNFNDEAQTKEIKQHSTVAKEEWNKWQDIANKNILFRIKKQIRKTFSKQNRVADTEW